MFSTFDRDNDRAKTENCAEACFGGWWYDDCTLSFADVHLNCYHRSANEITNKEHKCVDDFGRGQTVSAVRRKHAGCEDAMLNGEVIGPGVHTAFGVGIRWGTWGEGSIAKSLMLIKQSS